MSVTLAALRKEGVRGASLMQRLLLLSDCRQDQCSWMQQGLGSLPEMAQQDFYDSFYCFLIGRWLEATLS